MSAAEQMASAPAFEIVGAGDDPDWHKRRASGVGASEAAVMLGVHPKHGEGGPAVLWSRKRGYSEPEDLDDLENVQWGHVMESVIVEQFSAARRPDGTPRYAGWRVEKTRAQLRSLAHPWALCTLDAWTWHPEHGRVPLEAKNVAAYQAERWVGGTPVEMWWQLQHQMLVTATPVAVIAACVGGNALWWEVVARDDDAQRLLATRGAEFWRCVREDRVPLHVPTLASVRALYRPGRESGLVQLSGGEWTAADERLVEIKAQQRTLEKERASLEARLKDAIGDHEAASIDNGATYTHRSQKRAEVTTAASVFKVLRRKAPKGD